MNIIKLVAVSLILISTTVIAQSRCRTPINIEIYDESSRHSANLLKALIKGNTVSKVKIENLLLDKYDRPKREIPYVHAKPTIFYRKNIDESCVVVARKAINSMGFDIADIKNRPYSYGNELETVRVSIPPRTHLYDNNGILSVISR